MRDPFAPPESVVRFFKPLANYLGLPTLPLHAHEAIVSFAIYEVLFAVVSPALSRKLVPKQYAAFSKRTRLNWDSRVTSQFQQVYILYLVIYTMLADPSRANTSWEERLWGYNGIIGLIQGSAVGYFLWDVRLSTMYMDIMGADSLAHAAGWLIITFIGFIPFANYYGPNFMLYELSTPFLNNHWFFDKLGMTGTTPQLINGILLITSFGLSRLVWGSWQCFRMFRDIYFAWRWRPSLVDKCEVLRVGADLQIPIGCRELPVWLGLLYVGGNTMLTILNFWWFNKMIAALRKRFTKPAEKGPDGKEVKKNSAEKKTS